MIQTGYVLGVIALGVVGIVRWRVGFIATLIVGFLSDPVRKLVPGEPVYLSVLVLVPLVASMIGAYRSGMRMSLRPVFAFHSALRIPLFLLVVVVLAQSLHAYLSTGSPVIAVIGLVAYLSPVPGILLGYHFVRTDRDVARFFLWHASLAGLLGIGVYLARAGYEWRLLDAVGEGLVTWTPTGETLFLQSGFFRTPEIAAWQIATAMCFVTLLAFAKRRSVSMPVLMLGTLLPFFMGALLFTGRRKSVVMFAAFLLVYLACVAYFRRGAVKTALVLGVLAIGGSAWLAVSGSGAFLQNPFVERGTRIGGAEMERFQKMSYEALRTVIRANGVFGAGAGAGSQGAQYFGGGAAIVGQAAEGGVAKILAELGIPGLIVGLWLAVALLSHAWKVARAAARSSLARSNLAFGMSGFLVANGLIFVIGHQVFGDAFVLFVMGTVIGFVLAVPKMAVGVRRSERANAPPGHAPPRPHASVEASPVYPYASPGREGRP